MYDLFRTPRADGAQAMLVGILLATVVGKTGENVSWAALIGVGVAFVRRIVMTALPPMRHPY